MIFYFTTFFQELTESQLGGSEIRTSDLSSPSTHLNFSRQGRKRSAAVRLAISERRLTVAFQDVESGRSANAQNNKRKRVAQRSNFSLEYAIY